MRASGTYEHAYICTVAISLSKLLHLENTACAREAKHQEFKYSNNTQPGHGIGMFVSLLCMTMLYALVGPGYACEG